LRKKEPNNAYTLATMMKKICIIGAGPGGLGALKVILDSPQYKAGLWIPTAFEAHQDIGGTWLSGPLYDSLTTNIPHPVMAYPSFSFPPSTPLYPNASVVLQYLKDYATHFNLYPHIRLNTTVKSVDRDTPNSQWKLTLSTSEYILFDLVIICNGHYNIPRYPNVPGLAHWSRAGNASHAFYYRRPHNIGNTVLVVGGGPSGLDICAEMCSSAHTVIHSFTNAPNENIGNLKRRGRVSRFHEDTHTVTFQDGTVESGIDHCILATGYDNSFSFLSADILHPRLPPPPPPLPADLYNTTYSVFPLAKHLFPLRSPRTTPSFPPWSMAFMGLLVRVVPFPIFEAQTRAVLHAFAHPEALDCTREAVDIMTRHEALRNKLGSDDPLVMAKAWFRFEPLEQFEYRDILSEFIGKGEEKVPQWEQQMYLDKGLLRELWVELERRGEAEEWVRGVGEGDRGGEETKMEWVDLVNRIKKWGQDREVDRTKL
jgi:hypothetical protein